MVSDVYVNRRHAIVHSQVQESDRDKPEPGRSMAAIDHAEGGHIARTLLPFRVDVLAKIDWACDATAPVRSYLLLSITTTVLPWPRCRCA